MPESIPPKALEEMHAPRFHLYLLSSICFSAVHSHKLSPVENNFETLECVMSVTHLQPACGCEVIESTMAAGCHSHRAGGTPGSLLAVICEELRTMLLPIG